MNAAIIGILSGAVTIIAIILLKLNKPLVYALILCGIGFIYVGFTWTDIPALISAAVQALFFLFFAYYGVKKNLYFLIAGYFLHGSWDLFYGLLFTPGLIPPHYDLFCMAIDFTMGAYLFALKYRVVLKTDHARA